MFVSVRMLKKKEEKEAAYDVLNREVYLQNFSQQQANSKLFNFQSAGNKTN